MTAINIKNRLARLEETSGIDRRRFVVIGPHETEEAAYARAGLRVGDDAQVMRVRLVSAIRGVGAINDQFDSFQSPPSAGRHHRTAADWLCFSPLKMVE